MPPGARSDAKTCQAKCRKARNRFRVGRVAPAADGSTLRLAYADPPYPGFARSHYNMPEVDHAKLIERLCARYDGWALSTHASTLQQVLALCPAGVRVACWVRPAHHGWNGWEPVILYGGRAVTRSPRDGFSEVLICRSRHRSHPDALAGMKPPAFAEWMFRLLGARAGDSLADLYPGSGAIGRAWNLYVGAKSIRTAKPSQLERVTEEVTAAERDDSPETAGERDGTGPAARRDTSEPACRRDGTGVTPGKRDASTGTKDPRDGSPACSTCGGSDLVALTRPPRRGTIGSTLVHCNSCSSGFTSTAPWVRDLPGATAAGESASRSARDGLSSTGVPSREYPVTDSTAGSAPGRGRGWGNALNRGKRR